MYIETSTAAEKLPFSADHSPSDQKSPTRPRPEFILALVSLLTAVSFADTKATDAKPPTVNDPPFELTLIAAEPADLRPATRSFMPEDLELAISPQDFRHLLAFLGSLE